MSFLLTVMAADVNVKHVENLKGVVLISRCKKKAEEQKESHL